MVYNGDSDGQDIVSLCDDFVNTDPIKYPIKEKTRAANKTLRKIWTWIFDAYGGWLFDDANNTTDFPIATANLVASQQDYDVPPSSLTIRGVEILPANSTVYQRLIEITEEDMIENMISEGSLFTTPGIPLYYRPLGNSIKLYPTPSTNVTAGIRVTFDRGSIAFASTSTTQQPGFVSEFHETVAVGMALEFSRRNALSSFTFLQDDMNRSERAIKDYYSARFQEKFPGRLTVFDDTREYM